MIPGSHSSRRASMSPAFQTSKARRTTSTFSCDIARAVSRVGRLRQPRADTPGCTTQACGIRDHAADYERAGVRVIGVSPDPPRAVAGFAAKHGLEFTLLADSEHAV